MITLELPFPPSINKYYKSWRGRVVLGAEGRSYKQVVGGICLEQRCKPLRGNLYAGIQFFPPDRRRRDLDNFLKCLLDALEGFCYEDDYQISYLKILRGPVRKQGKVKVNFQREKDDPIYRAYHAEQKLRQLGIPEEEILEHCYGIPVTDETQAGV